MGITINFYITHYHNHIFDNIWDIQTVEQKDQHPSHVFVLMRDSHTRTENMNFSRLDTFFSYNYFVPCFGLKSDWFFVIIVSAVVLFPRVKGDP